jgi:tRNA threonylcarbamoyladenosine biosynthesis protein TsaB
VRALSIETATAVTAVGLLDGDDVHEAVVDTERRHTEALAPGVADLLARRGLVAASLDAVVVDVGPGLFTGLRVGISFAKGLAVATGLELYAVSSTEVLAATAFDAGVTGGVLAVVDARRAEVFAACYHRTDDGPEPTGGVAVATPEAIAARFAEGDRSLTVVGDGAARYREVFEAHGLVVHDEPVVPSPAAALALVKRRIAAGAAPLGHRDVHPSYLRDADAVANFSVRGTPT